MLREIDAHSGNRLSGSLPLRFATADVIDRTFAAGVFQVVKILTQGDR